MDIISNACETFLCVPIDLWGHVGQAYDRYQLLKPRQNYGVWVGRKTTGLL